MKILVAAGPTREPIDPVRFISNRSSGKMGYAIASAALKNGHAVLLVSGPVAIKPPAKAKLVRVVTAREMLSAVKANLPKCDALIMAAAVSDWRPAKISKVKIKKHRMPRALPLARNPDILRIVAGEKGKRIFIGFAAETGHLRAEALRKLRAKNLDLIVANDIRRTDAGFEADTNRVTFFSADGKQAKLPLMTKEKVAERIVAWLEKERRRRSINDRLKPATVLRKIR